MHEFVYHVYDLQAASTRHLFCLNCIESPYPPDIQISFTDKAPKQPISDSYFYLWRPPDGGLGFWTRLSEGYAEYTISADGRAITVSHSAQAPFLEVMRYITGVSLGAALRFRGVTVLHASAVLVNGSAILFAGPSHAGKSSLSAAFHRRGYSLITEDVCALDQRDDGIYVRPGYAGIRLYPETLDLLYGPDAVPEAMRVDQKYLHRLDTIPTSPCPVRALYLLAPRNPRLAQPRVALIDKQSALLALASQFYLHRFGPKEWLARDFPRLGELVQRIPVYVLERPDALSCLDATIDLILEQQASGEPDGMRQMTE